MLLFFLCAVIYPWIVHTEINRWEVFGLLFLLDLMVHLIFISGQYRILLEADGQSIL